MSSLVPPSEQRKRAEAEEPSSPASPHTPRDDDLFGSGGTRSDDDEDEAEEGEKYPTPDTEYLIKEWKMGRVVECLREMTSEEFMKRVSSSNDYVGGPNALKRMDFCELDNKGRFMRPDLDGEPEELRFCYAAKGRSAFGFVNGKTGNAFPGMWASTATRPTTIFIEDTPANPSMRRKRALEGGREYTCLVFTNAQQPRTWSIGTSLPPVNKKAEQALRAATHVFSTRVKALNVNMLKPSDPSAKRYMWAEPSLGGESYYPRVERSLTVKGGDSREPGRLSDRADDHDLLRSIGESNSLQYNTVPEVTVLDTKDRHFYRINWHLAHELPATTFWEVGFFVRQYTSTATKKIGFTLVLESLVAHGKAISDDITSPIPRKRKVDYFTDGNDDSRKKVGSAS